MLVFENRSVGMRKSEQKFTEEHGVKPHTNTAQMQMLWTITLKSF